MSDGAMFHFVCRCQLHTYNRGAVLAVVNTNTSVCGRARARVCVCVCVRAGVHAGVCVWHTVIPYSVLLGL